MPDRFGEPVVDLLVCFLFLRTRLRASQTPGIPCSLFGRDDRHKARARFAARTWRHGSVRDVETSTLVMPGLDPGIHPLRKMDCRVIGERKRRRLSNGYARQ